MERGYSQSKDSYCREGMPATVTAHPPERGLLDVIAVNADETITVGSQVST